MGYINVRNYYVNIYTGKNLTTCQQDVFATTLLFYQVATRLSLATCWQIVELQDDNKLLEQHCYMSAAGLLKLVRFYVTVYNQGWKIFFSFWEPGSKARNFL